MNKEDIIVIGGGPCGLAAAIALQEKGYRPLIIEKGNIVHTLYKFPTHQTFFSSEKLEIGDVAFVNEQRKPSRNQALSYYREVVKRKNLRIHTFEEVTNIHNHGDHFEVTTLKREVRNTYHTKYVIIATGYYDNPNMIEVPGEELDKVFHYFKEAHPFFDKDVVVIGGKNSAIDAGIELHKAGARVTVIYRGPRYSDKIKPWVLPEFDALVRHGLVNIKFNAHVTKITNDYVYYEVEGKQQNIKNDFVFAMTGYRPDHSFLEKVNVQFDKETGRPIFNKSTMETNVSGIFIAGVIAAGYEANEIFIENGRFHGEFIANAIAERDKDK